MVRPEGSEGLVEGRHRERGDVGQRQRPIRVLHDEPVEQLQPTPRTVATVACGRDEQTDGRHMKAVCMHIYAQTCCGTKSE